MGKQKRLTDEQLEVMGRNMAAMHELAITVWRDAIPTLLINSAMYRQICMSGRKVQETYYALREEALIRGWSDERINTVFYSRIGCGFS